MKIEIKPTAAQDVQEIVITDHPTVTRGVPRRVGYCGVSGVGFIVEHHLTESEMNEVEKFAKEAIKAADKSKAAPAKPKES